MHNEQRPMTGEQSANTPANAGDVVRVERMAVILAEAACNLGVIRELCVQAACEPQRGATYSTAASVLAQLTGALCDEALTIAGAAPTDSIHGWLLPPGAR
jgi:hypothetical protein